MCGFPIFWFCCISSKRIWKIFLRGVLIYTPTNLHPSGKVRSDVMVNCLIIVYSITSFCLFICWFVCWFNSIKNQLKYLAIMSMWCYRRYRRHRRLRLNANNYKNGKFTNSNVILNVSWFLTKDCRVLINKLNLFLNLKLQVSLAICYLFWFETKNLIFLSKFKNYFPRYLHPNNFRNVLLPNRCF